MSPTVSSSVTKQKVTDKATLTCSVKTNGRCDYKVKWLHNCPAGATDVKQCESKQPDCSAAVCFIGQSYMEGCKFKCEVTHGGTRQLFNFSDPSLENKSVETKAETTCSPTREIEGSREPGVPYISTAVVVVIILIGAGVVIGWRTKRNKRRVHYNADQNVNPPASPTGGESSYATLNPEDVHYATIGEAQVAGDEDTVTYSTVGAPLMSVAASSPDNSHAVIYSQVREVQRKP
ncbi:PREDICTED: uncharacterized protein LOC107099605 isoform X2 [Cyprinodon variegatus]|uniref:uncharacterized protein LOC107099605 isoform X2 n=1 Tax=Cyprinodon variegatus TaxID=28743 RepID=UPI000742C49D|nr:PREDICTED: uncharacterized protein LOC107099605 isoform X2 [Cyprinodon variegatus]